MPQNGMVNIIQIFRPPVNRNLHFPRKSRILPPGPGLAKKFCYFSHKIAHICRFLYSSPEKFLYLVLVYVWTFPGPFGIIRGVFLPETKRENRMTSGKGALSLNSIADVWKNVLDRLRSQLSETTINTWFDEVDVVTMEDSAFVLHCSNAFKKSTIEARFMSHIKAALKDIFPRIWR